MGGERSRDGKARIVQNRGSKRALAKNVNGILIVKVAKVEGRYNDIGITVGCMPIKSTSSQAEPLVENDEIGGGELRNSRMVKAKPKLKVLG